METHGHDRHGDGDAPEGREEPGQRCPQPQHGKEENRQLLLPDHRDKENGGKGQKAGDFPDRVQRPHLKPVKAGDLNGKIGDQRGPDRVANSPARRHDHDQGDGLAQGGSGEFERVARVGRGDGGHRRISLVALQSAPRMREVKTPQRHACLDPRRKWR